MTQVVRSMLTQVGDQMELQTSRWGSPARLCREKLLGKGEAVRVAGKQLCTGEESRSRQCPLEPGCVVRALKGTSWP